jgi:secreted trypsin-like serine protease
MKAVPAKIFAVLAAVLPILAICVVSMAHAAVPPAAPTAQASVIGGQPAPPGKFPWMAFIVDFLPNEKEVTACSGTVLTPTIVLTAGHCVVDEHSGALEEAAGFRVVTGAVNWTYPERQLTEVSKVIPYPKFVPGTARDGFGDAALLVLSTPTTVPPIPLATAPDKRLLKIGTRAVIAGWGLTNPKQKEFTESLMWSRTVVDSDRCEGLWGRICAIDFPKATSGACHGDSGGPLLVPRKHGYVEIGIVEAGFGDCTTRRPQLFTRTDLLSKWIKSRIRQIEKVEANPPPSSPQS